MADSLGGWNTKFVDGLLRVSGITNFGLEFVAKNLANLPAGYLIADLMQCKHAVGGHEGKTNL